MRKLTRPEEEALYFKYPAPVVEIKPYFYNGSWYCKYNADNAPDGVSLKCEQMNTKPGAIYTSRYVRADGYVSPQYSEDGWIRLIFFFEDREGNRSPEREEFFPLDEQKIKEKYGNKKEKEMDIPKELYGKPEKQVEAKSEHTIHLEAEKLVEKLEAKIETVKKISNNYMIQKSELEAENKKLKEEWVFSEESLAIEKKLREELQAENEKLNAEIHILKITTVNAKPKPDPEAGKFTLETSTTEGDVVDTHTDEEGRVYDKKTRQPLKGLHTETIKGKTHKWDVATKIINPDELMVSASLMDVRLNSLGVPKNERVTIKLGDLYNILIMARYDNGSQVPAMFADGSIEGCHVIEKPGNLSSFSRSFKLVPEGRTRKVIITVVGGLPPSKANPFIPGKNWSPEHADWIEDCEIEIELPESIPDHETAPEAPKKERPPTKLIKEIQRNRDKFLNQRPKNTDAAKKWSETEKFVLSLYHPTIKSDINESRIYSWYDKAKRLNWEPALTTLPKIIDLIKQRRNQQ